MCSTCSRDVWGLLHSASDEYIPTLILFCTANINLHFFFLFSERLNQETLLHTPFIFYQGQVPYTIYLVILRTPIYCTATVILLCTWKIPAQLHTAEPASRRRAMTLHCSRRRIVLAGAAPVSRQASPGCMAGRLSILTSFCNYAEQIPARLHHASHRTRTRKTSDEAGQSRR